MGNQETVDVAVVGGGPGGSAAATFIAMQGHRVVLLEREKFPRHQIGESLLPATVHGVCKLLGVTEEMAAANFVVKRGGVFQWGRGTEPWTFDWSHHPMLEQCAADYAYQVERATFDDILLRNAARKGVEVREQCRTTGPIVEHDRVQGVLYRDKDDNEHEIRAKFVVDASGHGSALSGFVGARQYSRFFQNVAIYGYYENGKRNPPPKEGSINCISFKEGWFWYIPLSDKLTSVGAVIAKEHAETLKKDKAVALQELIDSCPAIKAFLADATRVTDGMYGQVRIRKDYSYTTERFWTPGLVLVGDAACFIDPIFSSGVHLATYAALLAARSINTCLRGGVVDERAAFTEFETRYRREFGVFYEFLLTFYDLNQTADSYFWNARSVLKTDEASNEAFMRLVAGASTTGQDFFENQSKRIRDEIGQRMRGVPAEEIGSLKALRVEGKRMVEMAFDNSALEDPNVATGLRLARDGMHWELQEPGQ